MPKLINLILTIVISLSFSGCTAVDMDHSIKNREERVGDFLKRYTQSEVPGIQYMVVNANKPIFEYAGGFADIQSRKVMTQRVTMLGYSMTKTFTAVAILQLVEKGKLDLEDKVITYLPNYPYGDQVTIRQLVTHTSGIPNPIPLRWAHLDTEHDSFDESVALNHVLQEHSGAFQ